MTIPPDLASDLWWALRRARVAMRESHLECVRQWVWGSEPFGGGAWYWRTRIRLPSIARET